MMQDQTGRGVFIASATFAQESRSTGSTGKSLRETERGPQLFLTLLFPSMGAVILRSFMLFWWGILAAMCKSRSGERR